MHNVNGLPWNPQPAVCPGCGKCNTCGRPTSPWVAPPTRYWGTPNLNVVGPQPDSNYPIVYTHTDANSTPPITGGRTGSNDPRDVQL